MKPTPEQVTRFTAELHRKFDHIPGMAARIDRGTALALAGDVYPLASTYAVTSSRNDGTGYPIAPGGRCCCPDADNGAPVVRGIATCKHSIAYNIWHRALTEALAGRILGGGDYGNRERQRHATNTFLLLLAGHDGTRLWSDRVGNLASVRWSTPLGSWIPATHADLLAAEKWIDAARGLPIDTLAETAGLEMLNDMDAMDRDATAMSFGAWRELYRPLLAR